MRGGGRDGQCHPQAPCAAITALSMSGLPTGRFTFEGFLSTTKKNRAQHLDSPARRAAHDDLLRGPRAQAVRDAARSGGGLRRGTAYFPGRELTKLRGEVLRLTLDGAVAYYETQPPRLSMF